MIVYTGGSFDVLHIGHVLFFEKIKRRFPNCTLVVSLNTDEFIERYKGRKPVFNYDERYTLLSRLNSVDKVVKNYGDENSKEAILTLRPHMLVIGSDWLNKDYLAQLDIDENFLVQNDIGLCYVPYTQEISSSEIKRRLYAR